MQSQSSPASRAADVSCDKVRSCGTRGPSKTLAATHAPGATTQSPRPRWSSRNRPSPGFRPFLSCRHPQLGPPSTPSSRTVTQLSSHFLRKDKPRGPGAPPLGPPVVLTAGPVSKEAQGDRHLGGGWGLESWMSFSIRHLPPKTAVPPSLPAGLSQGWAPGEQGTRPVGHTYKWWQVRDGRTVGKCVRTQVSDSGPQQ